MGLIVYLGVKSQWTFIAAHSDVTSELIGNANFLYLKKIKIKFYDKKLCAKSLLHSSVDKC